MDSKCVVGPPSRTHHTADRCPVALPDSWRQSQPSGEPMAGPRWVLGGAGRMDRLKTRGGRPPKKPVSDPSRPTAAQGEDRARSARRPLCLGATPLPGWLLGKAKTGSHGLAFFRCQSQWRSSRVVLTPASRRGALPVFEMTTPSCRKRRRTVHFRASPLVSSGTTTCKELQVLFSASQSLRSFGGHICEIKWFFLQRHMARYNLSLMLQTELWCRGAPRNEHSRLKGPGFAASPGPPPRPAPTPTTPPRALQPLGDTPCPVRRTQKISTGISGKMNRPALWIWSKKFPQKIPTKLCFLTKRSPLGNYTRMIYGVGP